MRSASLSWSGPTDPALDEDLLPVSALLGHGSGVAVAVGSAGGGGGGAALGQSREGRVGRDRNPGRRVEVIAGGRPVSKGTFKKRAEPGDEGMETDDGDDEINSLSYHGSNGGQAKKEAPAQDALEAEKGA